MANDGKIEHMEFLNMAVESTSDIQALFSKTMESCERCGVKGLSLP